ncbi:chorismate mutase [Candidatus Woesearchaeota archaeon]|nr:chorismate mutase [Candidatus Woesearchaeota archaeon]
MDRLGQCRKRIDAIDKNIAKLLLKRFELVNQIGSYKKRNKVKVDDKKREAQVISNIKKISNEHKKFIMSIFKNIINYSKKLQKNG